MSNGFFGLMLYLSFVTQLKSCRLQTQKDKNTQCRISYSFFLIELKQIAFCFRQ